MRSPCLQTLPRRDALHASPFRHIMRALGLRQSLKGASPRAPRRRVVGRGHGRRSGDIFEVDHVEDLL